MTTNGVLLSKKLQELFKNEMDPVKIRMNTMDRES